MAGALGEQAANDGVNADQPRVDAPSVKGPGRLAAGTILNNIWEVRRLHASGGMGEVYEGLNTGTDEKVAIKVMRERFAEDPKIGGLLRSEARKMTRIRHPAVVHYIVMATEPTLGVPYIVMDYIDGVGLDKVIGQVQPTQDELLTLMRRLAEGLRAAHEQGVFHRDLSPDNILLPGRQMADAKIIDFGIAKDIDGSHTTIVGDSFAGKIGFAAPEQFGDFEREIGPWTDIYSLGLVMLSLAQGSTVNMGSTLVEAVDRRRVGPNLTGLPPGLRSVFERMLAANPAARFRSMDALIEALTPLVGAANATEPLAVLAPQDQDLAAKQRYLAEAQAAISLAQNREREAAAAAAAAGETYLKAANDLKQVTDLQVSPTVLRVTQQELDAAQQAREAAERAHRAAQEEVGLAARRLSQAQTEHDTVFLAKTGVTAASALPLAAGVAASAAAQSQLGGAAPTIPPPATIPPSQTTGVSATVPPMAAGAQTFAPALQPAVATKRKGGAGWLILALAAVVAALAGAAVLGRDYLFPHANAPVVAVAPPPVVAPKPPPPVVPVSAVPVSASPASASPASVSAAAVAAPVITHVRPKPTHAHHATAGGGADAGSWAAGTDQQYVEDHPAVDETTTAQANPYPRYRRNPRLMEVPMPRRFTPVVPNPLRPRSVRPFNHYGPSY